MMIEPKQLATRWLLAVVFVFSLSACAAAQDTKDDTESEEATYSESEIFQKASTFFGSTT